MSTTGQQPAAIELRIDAAHEAVDWIHMVAAAAGYSGEVRVIHRADEVWPITLVLYLPDDERARGLLQRMSQDLDGMRRAGLASGHQVVVGVITKIIGSISNADRIGRFLVTADTDAAVPPSGGILLRLPQRLAFGSGLHPATQLSLSLIERLVVPGSQTLDLGCGSGILSIAMAKLGAQVLALDNDAAAVAAALENVRVNEVESQVVVAQGSLGHGAELGHWLGWDVPTGGTAVAPDGKFDLLVANILARMHLELASDYRRALRGNPCRPGLLITAGFTVDREDDVDLALQRVGFEPHDREAHNEWVALAHRLSPRETG